MKTIASALFAFWVLAGISGSASAYAAHAPFSFACTTDGGQQPGCTAGWTYR